MITAAVGQVVIYGFTPTSGGGGGGIGVTEVVPPGGGPLSSPYTLAESTAASIGDTVVVFMSTRNTADTAGTLKDSKGNCSNAYTEHAVGFNSTAGAIWWECKLTVALTTSDHWTYTPTTDFSFTWLGIKITGLTTGLDNLPSPTSNIAGSTTETTPTYTPAHANEAVCYFISTSHGTFSAYGNLIGSAPTLSDTNTVVNSGYGSIGCRVISSATAGSGSVTLSVTSDGWIGTIGGYY